MGKRLAESNCKKREAKKREEQVKLEASRVNQYYGIGTVLAVVLVITFIEPRKDKQEEKSRILQQCVILLSPNNLRLTNLRWINLF